MKAQIPYLARLARQAAGIATLRPPGQLFAGATYTPVRSPGRDDSLLPRAGVAAAGSFPGPVQPSNVAEELAEQPGIAFPRGADAVGDRADGPPEARAGLASDAGVPPIPAPFTALSTGVPPVPVPSTVRATGVPPAPGGLDMPGPPDLASRSSLAARGESPRAADTTSVAAVHAEPVAQPVTPLPSSSSRPAGDAARVQPGSGMGPLRGTAADLPQAARLVPVTGDTDRRVPSGPGATVPAPAPGPASLASPRHGPPRTEPAIPATPPPAPGIPATPPPAPGPASIIASPHHGPPRTEPGIPATPPPAPRPASTASPHHGPPRTEPAIPATPPPAPRPASTASPRHGPPGTEPSVTATPGVTAAPSPTPGPASIASPHHGLPRTEPGVTAAPGVSAAPVVTAAPGVTATSGGRNAADEERPGEPTVVRDLIPPPSPATRPITVPGPEQGEPYQQPRVPGAPRVSIGTIDVTVLPPAPPAPPAPEIRPPAQVARGWTRPPSLLAATAGAGRLRDGVRRWYGTAQG